jgi:hypothetical protein
MGDSDHILIVQSAIKEKETTKLINLKKKKKSIFPEWKIDTDTNNADSVFFSLEQENDES